MGLIPRRFSPKPQLKLEVPPGTPEIFCDYAVATKVGDTFKIVLASNGEAGRIEVTYVVRMTLAAFLRSLMWHARHFLTGGGRREVIDMPEGDALH
jgi:hypothetical protein